MHDRFVRQCAHRVGLVQRLVVPHRFEDENEKVGRDVGLARGAVLQDAVDDAAAIAQRLIRLALRLGRAAVQNLHQHRFVDEGAHFVLLCTLQCVADANRTMRADHEPQDR